MLLTKSMNRRVGRAMHDYSMLAGDDRVLVAVSGGVDSLVLANILAFWQRKAPIRYTLFCVHVDMGHVRGQCSDQALAVREQLERSGLSLEIVAANYQPDESELAEAQGGKDVCFFCSRSRRNQLFELARHMRCSKIALGHHQDDIIETFFLNLCYAGNISTMTPGQELFESRLTIIRPMAYLRKEEIHQAGARLGLMPVRSSCPLGERTKRTEMRSFLGELYRRMPEARKNIFSALANVRQEYLLKGKSS